MNYEVLAVDVKHMSVHGFLGDGETEEELLNRANEYKDREIVTWSNHCVKYPEREEFMVYLKKAQETEYQIMTLEEYEKLQRDYYINSKSLQETTEECFEDMLNILPPLKWCSIDGVEMFCMSEMYISTFTDQYARYDGKYYTKMVDVVDKSTWINNYLGITA